MVKEEVVDGEAEVREEIEEIVVVEVEASPHQVLVGLIHLRRTRGTRAPGTRTCPRSRSASAIGPLGNLHIFVWNQQPVPGKITGFQSLINETGTSLARHSETLIIFTIFCILTITYKTRKYMKCF